MTQQKPNILILMSDQHTPQLMGCMGADFVRTPTMDRLAEEGTLFTNAYCAYPHCVPSRAAFMTGLETHKIGCYDNGAPFSSGIPTWAHMMRHAGYYTGLNGKMHFVGEDFCHGFHDHVNEPRCAVAGCRWGEERPNPDVGRQYWADLHFEGDPVYEKRMSEELERVDSAVEFLKNYDGDQPFCYTVSFVGPHYPQVCPREVYDSYENVNIPDPLEKHDLHPHLERWWRVWGFDRLTREQVIDARRLYLGMITMVDTWMGQVLDALEQSGHADNTIIIYTADHGEMWGEHGLWGKQVFYEESVRIPLIITGANHGVKPGFRIDTPVTQLDIYPTLRDIIGHIGWNIPLDGRSLWPTVTNGIELDDVPICSEYHGPDIKGPGRMVRYKQWKLNYYHHQEPELYDLDSDPNERHNLAGNPDNQQVIESLMAKLTKDWDPAEMDQRIREDQNRRSLVGECYPDAIKAL